MCSTYRMHFARPKQFPSGFLVAALLAANGLLWAVMFFGSLAHLERLASGLTAFDIRPRGYPLTVREETILAELEHRSDFLSLRGIAFRQNSRSHAKLCAWGRRHARFRLHCDRHSDRVHARGSGNGSLATLSDAW